MPGAHGGAPSSPLVACVYTGRYTPTGAPDRRTKVWKAYVAKYPDSAMWRFEEMPGAAEESVSGSFAEMSRKERNAAFSQHPSQIKKQPKTFAEMKPRERNAAFAKHPSQIKKTPPVKGSTEPVLQTRAESAALDFCWIASLRNALAQNMSDTPPSPAPYGLDPFGHPHPAPYLAAGVPTDAELGEEFCAIRDAPLPDPEGYPMEKTRRGEVESIAFNDPRRCPRELVGSIAFDSTGLPRWPGMRQASPSPPPQRRLRSRCELVDGMWKGK